MDKNLAAKIKRASDKKVSKLKQRTLNSPRFVLAKKEHKVPETLFNQMIDSFYDDEFPQIAKVTKLSKNLTNEINLFDWVKDNGYQATKDDFARIQDFLFKVDSHFYKWLNYFRYEFNKPQNTPDTLFRYFLDTWERLLVKNIIEYKFAKLEEQVQKFNSELYKRIEIYKDANRVLRKVWNFFGNVWDPKEHITNLKEMEVIDKFAVFLQQNPALLEIAKMIGRLKGESEIIDNREVIEENIKTQIDLISGQPEQIFGITQSNNLEAMLSTEVVYLNDDILKLIFYKNYVENKLTVWDFFHLEETFTTEFNVVNIDAPIPEESGPVILSIDTSRSMKGPAEIIAKALALAISRACMKEKRDCYMINFSTNLEVFDLSTIGTSVPSLIEFLMMNFNGNTNMEPAILHTIDVIKNRQFKNADMIMISDFIAPDFSEELVEDIQVVKDKHNRFHAICIGTSPDVNNFKFFDNKWIYDPRSSFAMENVIQQFEQEVTGNKWAKLFNRKKNEDK